MAGMSETQDAWEAWVALYRDKRRAGPVGTVVRDLEQAVYSAQLAIEVLAGALSADPEEKEWAAQVRRVQDLPANQIALIVEDIKRTVTAMTRFAEKLSHTRA
jgi:hypothetical protein